MAACIVEDTRSRSIYYQTKQIKFFQDYFYAHTDQMDSTKKRQLNRSNTFNSNIELTKTETDNSCSIQSVAIDSNNESMKVF